jgi:hypothetical protein
MLVLVTVLHVIPLAGAANVTLATMFEYASGIPVSWNERTLNQYVVSGVNEYTVVVTPVRFSANTTGVEKFVTNPSVEQYTS